MEMNKDQIMGYIRHALTFAGGFIVAKGLIPAEMLNEAIGAAVTLIGVIWSAVSKTKPVTPV